MIDKVKKTIEKHKMLSKKDGVVVGLSGGPDSMALIHVLSQLKTDYDLTLIAVHVNHMFRGSDADNDALYVADFCKRINVPLRNFKVDVAKYAHEHGFSFEEAGRKIRYDLFEKVMIEEGAKKIAVGQNENDVLETFFINLFRGAGIDGLSSIEYMRENKIIRPLLDVARSEIEVYLDANGLEARQDLTNQESIYVRNRIRNEMIPYIKMHFNPNFHENLSKSIQIMKEEKEFWDERERALLDDISQVRLDQNAIGLDLARLRALHPFEAKRLIRSAIKSVRGHLTDLSYENLNQILALKRTGTYVDLDTRFTALCQYNVLWIKEKPQDQVTFSIPKLSIRQVDVKEFQSLVLQKKEVAIDADTVKGDLHVRFRKSGDRFIPKGMTGQKKIKDYFIDEKIPRDERDRIALVCDSEKIVWVEERRIHDHCKITEKTKNILIITLEPVVQ